METILQLIPDLGLILVIASLAVAFTYRGKRAYLAIRFKVQGRR